LLLHSLTLRHAAAAGIILWGSAVCAQVVWDGGGGNNRWNTNNNWNPNGTPGAGTDVLLDNSLVATLPGTIELRGNRNARSLTFDTGDTVAIVNGTGNRSLDLYSGQLTRTSGSSGSQSLDFRYLDLRADGAFAISGSGDFTISAQIRDDGGSRAITKTGDGLLIFTNNNLYTGLTTISDGILRITNASALGTTAAGTVVNATGELQLSGGLTINDELLTLAGAGTSGALVNAAGSNTWNSNLSLSGAATIANTAGGTTLTLGTSGANRTLANNGHTLTLDGAGNILFNAQTGGTGGLVKNGTGTTTLSYGNASDPTLSVYSGATQVNDGTLIVDIGGNNGVPATPLTGDITVGSADGSGTSSMQLRYIQQVGDSTAVRVNRTGTLTLDATVYTSTLNETIGSLTMEGGGRVESLDGTGTATFTLNGDLTRVATGGSTAEITGRIDLGTGSRVITVADAIAPVDLRISAAASGNLTSLTKAGAGTLELAGANSFTAPITVTGGILQVAADANLGDAANDLFLTNGTLATTGSFTLDAGRVVTLGGAGGGLDVATGTTLTLAQAGQLTGSGTLTKTGGGILALTALPSFNDTLDLNAGTLSLTDLSLSLANLNITGNSTIDFSGASTLSVTNLTIAAGVTLTITNWDDAFDYFFVENFSGGVVDVRGAAPMNQVVFSSFSGNDTKWQSYDNQITPVPEPSTYGALLLLLSGGLLAWRRRRSR